MRFSPSPPLSGGDTGFNQWRDAMKMVARLPGGIPADFRRKLWIALAEKHLQARGVNWAKEEKVCFNEWTNPDDSELGIQIVKVRQCHGSHRSFLTRPLSRTCTGLAAAFSAARPGRKTRRCSRGSFWRTQGGINKSGTVKGSTCSPPSSSKSWTRTKRTA